MAAPQPGCATCARLLAPQKPVHLPYNGALAARTGGQKNREQIFEAVVSVAVGVTDTLPRGDRAGLEQPACVGEQPVEPHARARVRGPGNSDSVGRLLLWCRQRHTYALFRRRVSTVLLYVVRAALPSPTG